MNEIFYLMFTALFAHDLPSPYCVTYGLGWAVFHMNDLTWYERS